MVSFWLWHGMVMTQSPRPLQPHLNNIGHLAQVAHGSALQTNPWLGASNLFQKLPFNLDHSILSLFPGFHPCDYGSALQRKEEKKSMTDLPTNHTRLTWLEREEHLSLSLPLATTHTLLLSKRKHTRTLHCGGKNQGPIG